ncbi:MAG: T9SS type A sorting domain-containing protein [Bacteroidota bacterium]|nr:T9SS type A sorting domain-containing protein [Bacteroidota bacterium]
MYCASRTCIAEYIHNCDLLSGYYWIRQNNNGPVNRDYSDLQTAINDADPGTIIILDAGVEFNGGFLLPDKGNDDKWIILISNRMDLLPAQGMRVEPFNATGDPGLPEQRSAMPKIITTNLSGLPCIKTVAKAHHYRFVGIEFTAAYNVINSYGLINFGDGSNAQNTLDKVPHHLIIDRCYVHGHTNAEIMKYGVRLDCSDGAIIDSHISDFHSVGFDAQAISGINGPGPFKIINNFLEGAGENILFGGAAPAIPGLVPSDIEIINNYFYKPWSWLSSGSVQIKVMTIDGRILFSNTVSEDQEIKIPYLPIGIYLVSLIEHRDSKILRLLVQR